MNLANGLFRSVAFLRHGITHHGAGLAKLNPSDGAKSTNCRAGARHMLWAGLLKLFTFQIHLCVKDSNDKNLSRCMSFK